MSQSLSARRAWIEIIDYIIDYVNDAVALRKESVDRNFSACKKKIGRLLSLSARRAWIEIPNGETLSALACVALRKESVDRNGLGFRYYRDDVSGRSPQGERG